MPSTSRGVVVPTAGATTARKSMPRAAKGKVNYRAMIGLEHEELEGSPDEGVEETRRSHGRRD